MRWQGRRQSSNIEDRRGQGGGFPGGFGGGMGPRIRIPGGGMRAGGGGSAGIIIVIIFVIIAWIAGINPLELLSGGTSLGPAPTETGRTGPVDDEGGQFVATVLAETEDTWTEIFAAEGARYEPPTLVFFDGQVGSACGYASAASGPFYCPGDRKVYIDLAFYGELRDRFGAPGDFAQAYVIAHEVGHHIQNLLGTLPEFHRLRQRLSEAEANRLSIRVELQADCYAGIWARSVEQRDILDEGDIDEALNAASQIGDDVLQRRTQGYVVPESFNHGTAEQRSRWFRRGYTQGNLAACDTFSVQDV